MKKLIFLLLFLLPLLGISQSMTAEFDSQKELVTVDGTNSYTKFQMKATEEEMKYAHDEALKYKAYMTLESSLVEAGIYQCKLSFNHIIHHAYIHKMLVAFAVEKFSWNNQSYGVNQWFEVFKM